VIKNIFPLIALKNYTDYADEIGNYVMSDKKNLRESAKNYLRKSAGNWFLGAIKN
jgi:hypothetical protein